MYLVESKGGAIVCMLLSLFFLGTWPAILTLLERRGRLPQHTYLDYSITNLLAAVIIAFTFGEIGTSTHDSPNFIDQLGQVMMRHQFSPQVGRLWRVAIISAGWLLWMERNARIFSDQRRSIDTLIILLRRMVGETVIFDTGRCFSLPREQSLLRDLRIAPRPGRAPRIIEVTWCCPPPNWIKCNTDGSSLGAPGLGRSAGVFRTSRGFVRGCFSQRIQSCFAFEAELLAAIMAVEAAHERGWSRLWLETDSLYVLSRFQTPHSEVPWRWRTRWLHLTQIRAQLQLHVTHIFREGNAVADALTHLTTDGWWPNLPSSLAALVGRDMSGQPYHRFVKDNWPSILFAMAGGVVLSIGNLSTQYAWAFVGLSVVEVVTSSITVVIGTTVNYFLDGRINRAEILFPGVGCFLVAVCLGSAVHLSNSADNKKKLDGLPSDHKLEAVTASSPSPKETFSIDGRKDLENGNGTAGKAKAGTAHFLIETEQRRSIKVFGRNILIGLAITFFAGVCFSLFSPAFNLATNDQWHKLKKGVPKLVVYTAFFWFSVSCFVLAIILNITFLYRPLLNLPRSSPTAYLNDWNGRGWALLAGLLCGFGNGLQFMGGQAAGYAAADAVQALPLVSTFWGILIFGEYRKSSRRTYVLLVGMLSMFIVAVGILMASSGHRK